MGTTLENIIRRITVSAKTDGVDETSAKLRGLAGAQSGVAVASEKTSTSTLSMEKRLNSLQRQLDESYRAEQNLAKANRDLSAAQAQGLITAQRRAELSDLAAKKFNVESAAAGRAAAAYKTLQSVGSSIAAGFAGGFLAGGLSQLPAMIDDVVASLANLNDASETIGVTTSRLQELQYVAGQTGVDQETLNGALEKFSLNLGLAAQGEGKLYDILKANHVLVSGDLTTDLMNYAELVKNARNEQERNLIVTAAFGRSAQEMGRFFADGAEGIAALGVEARLTGAIIDQDLVKQAARLDDEMEKLKPKMEAAGSALAVAFGPAQIWLLEQATVAANQLAFAVDSIGKGKVGDAASVVFGFEGFGDGAHSRYLDNLIKSRQLDMEAGLTPDGADDFYSGFGMREETSRRETHETNAPTLLPPDRDAEASLKAYEKLIETSKKRTDQIMIETEALGMVGTAADLYRNTQTLLNEAEAAGVEMTPQRIEQLTELAEAQTDAQLTLEGLHMEMENRTPWEVMGDEMVRIQDLLDKGKIGWDDYAIGVGKVVEDMVGNYSNGADNVLDNVEKLTDALALEGKEQFEIHKTISIARAVVAGGEAIVNSYNAGTALGGGPLLGAAFAGIAAAATAAQIASIASTTYSSKSPIGAGGSSADAPTGAALQGQTQGTVIQFVGDRNSPTTLGAVESLLARLNDELGVNGKEIVVRYKGSN